MLRDNIFDLVIEFNTEALRHRFFEVLPGLLLPHAEQLNGGGGIVLEVLTTGFQQVRQHGTFGVVGGA